MKCKKPQVRRSSLCGANPKGHTTVEMAMLMFPFFIMIFSVMEFGWFFLHQHTLQFAAREGMRMAMVGEVLNDESGDPLTREDTIMQIVKEKVSWAMDPDEVTVEFGPLGANYEDPDNFDDPNAAPNAGNPADYMRIQVKYDHQFFMPLIGELFDNDCSDGCSIKLEAQATYRNELFLEV